MKTSDIKNIIRQIVKEEVHSEVNKAMAKIMVELIKEIKSSPIEKERITETREPATIPSRQSKTNIITNNPKLNAVLAETAKHFKPIPNSPREGSLVSLMDGGFEKAGSGDAGDNVSRPIESKVEYLKSIVSSSPEGALKQSITESAAVPDILKKVFNKDFRQVMRSIDKAKRSGGSGIINPSQVLSG